jgi:hypothetical protein
LATLDDAVGFNHGLALALGQLSDRLEVLVERDAVMVERLLHRAHCIFQRRDLAVQLNELLGEWVGRVDLLVNVVQVDLDRVLAFSDHFLQLLVLLLECIDVSVNRGLRKKRQSSVGQRAGRGRREGGTLDLRVFP